MFPAHVGKCARVERGWGAPDLRKERRPLASPACGSCVWIWERGMGNLLAAPGELFRDRDFFVHDGTKLRLSRGYQDRIATLLKQAL